MVDGLDKIENDLVQILTKSNINSKQHKNTIETQHAEVNHV